MATRYLWDSQAAQEIANQTLDKLFADARKHYIGLAKGVWEDLQRINPGALLKHGDLYDALFPLIHRDGVTLTGMTARHLPGPLGHGASK